MFYADHIYQVDVSFSLLSFIDQLPYEDLTPLQAAVAVVQKVYRLSCMSGCAINIHIPHKYQ